MFKFCTTPAFLLSSKKGDVSFSLLYKGAFLSGGDHRVGLHWLHLLRHDSMSASASCFLSVSREDGHASSWLAAITVDESSFDTLALVLRGFADCVEGHT